MIGGENRGRIETLTAGDWAWWDERVWRYDTSTIQFYNLLGSGRWVHYLAQTFSRTKTGQNFKIKFYSFKFYKCNILKISTCRCLKQVEVCSVICKFIVSSYPTLEKQWFWSIAVKMAAKSRDLSLNWEEINDSRSFWSSRTPVLDIQDDHSHFSSSSIHMVGIQNT